MKKTQIPSFHIKLVIIPESRNNLDELKLLVSFAVIYAVLARTYSGTNFLKIFFKKGLFFQIKCLYLQLQKSTLIC